MCIRDRGPVAALEIIKHLGTNGGGFIGANSATPIENPTILTNLIELYSMMLLPGACVITFGKMVRDRKCEAQAGSTAFTVRSGVDSRSFTARFFGRAVSYTHLFLLFEDIVQTSSFL